MWICNYVGKDNTCWPSIALIAEDCGLCRNTVKNCIKKLELRGILKTTYRKRKGTKESESNLYQIIIRGGSTDDQGGSNQVGKVGQQMASNSIYNKLKPSSRNLTTDKMRTPEEQISLNQTLDRIKEGLRSRKIGQIN
jgi:DNA-binding Lrp family transcriptional regulator